MRTRLIVSIIALAFCNGMIAQTPSINVMSFNIRYPNPNDSIHYWDNRRPLVASLIQSHKVDLLGIQEAYRRQLDEMISDMPEYAWFGVSRSDGTIKPSPDSEFSAILYRKDRFELLDGNTFWLSDTPYKPGSIGWDAALPRIVTWANFKDKLTGNIFFHFNTHFDHEGTIARFESAKLLVKLAESIAGDYTIIITGDFNCTDADLPYLTMTSDTSLFPLIDAMKISNSPHKGPEATFAGNFKETGLDGRRIDFIFVRNGVEVLEHAIHSDSWDGNLASDHLPVSALIRIN